MTLAEFVFCGALFMNGLAFLNFLKDKQAAKRQDWRVSETSLLFLAFCGGSIGAKIAQQVLRHKTRKQPFASTLNKIRIFNLILAIPVGYFLLSGGGWSDLGPVGHMLMSTREAVASGDERDARQVLPKRFGPGS